jgi:plastocyanin
MHKFSIPGGFYLTLAVITVFFIMMWLVMFQRVVSEFATLTPAPIHRADFQGAGFPRAGSSTIVTYNDAGFSPSSVTITNGTTVVFENKSSNVLWPISVSRPAQDEYPAGGSCGGSAFDACGEIPSGKAWAFRFDVSGTWGYDNYREPGDTGTVVVE